MIGLITLTNTMQSLIKNLANSTQKTLKSTNSTGNGRGRSVFLAPIRYNRGQKYKTGDFKRKSTQNQSKSCINVDWLEMSFRATIDPPNADSLVIYENGDIILEKLEYSWTKRYREGYRLYVYGEDFGRVEAIPVNPNIDGNLIKIQVDNHILYQRGWVERLKYVEAAMRLEFNNVSRLDIALDMENGHFISDYAKLERYELKKVGKAKVSTFKDSNMQLEGFYIGSSSSERMIRGYIKTKELKESGGVKTYIPEYWKANGIDPAKRVERLEIMLRGKAMRKVEDFDYGRLEETAYLAGIMRSQMRKFYEFSIPNEREKNESRWKRVEAFNWSVFDCVEVTRVKKTSKPSVVWSVKHAISFDMREAYERYATDRIYQDFKAMHEYCMSRAAEYGLIDWFLKKANVWELDYKYHLKIKEARAIVAEIATAS